MKDASGFQYFLTDHLGSTSVVLSTAGAIPEQQRYMPFGQARTVAPYANITSPDFTYTGQRALPNTGLMDYKARFYSPSLGRFIQPDTIIPGPANPQSWNRFSYVSNNPVRFTDPTGHKVACEAGDGNGCTKDKGYSKLDSLKYKVTKNYAIHLNGNWKEDELTKLNAALDKLAQAVGGMSNLNAAIAQAVNKMIYGTTTIDVERVAQPRWNPASSQPSVAAWCQGLEETCTKSTIVLADDAFSASYQFRAAAYGRNSFTSDLNVAIQFTMAHEFSHVLSTANPMALGVYQTALGGTEESLANELALQAIVGGSQFGAFAFGTGFWDYSCTNDCKMVK